MVKYASILATNNAFFSNTASKHLTAVFLGATDGIGLGTLRAYAKHTSGTTTTIYIVGRSQNRLNALQTEIATLNSSATLIPIQTSDLTDLSTALAAAKQISSHVQANSKKVDFLIMSPGYISLGREENSSGLDRVQTIRFYTRMLFLQTLAPYLRASPHARVVTILGGGLEGKLWADDLELSKHYSLPSAADASASMMTLFLEEFAKRDENKGISSAHTFPGMVGGTGIQLEGLPAWGKFLLNWIALPLVKVFGYSVEEAGERALYATLNEEFERGKPGSSDGVVLVKGDSSVAPANKVLVQLRKEGFGEKVWEHTIRVFEEVEQK